MTPVGLFARSGNERINRAKQHLAEAVNSTEDSVVTGLDSRVQKDLKRRGIDVERKMVGGVNSGGVAEFHTRETPKHSGNCARGLLKNNQFSSSRSY